MISREPAADLVAKAKRFRLVLAPCGRAFANLRQSFIDECESVLSLEDALDLKSPPGTGLVMITGLEEVDRKKADESNPLGALRERVNQMLETGSSVILLSRYPKMRYPDVVGSSLLEDACDFHPPTRETAQADHRLHPLPSWDSSLDDVAFLTDLVAELGTPLVARLDQILFENPLRPSDALSDLSAPERDALYFAGLIRPSNDKFIWSIPDAIEDLKGAIANCLAATLTPPRDLALAYESLWKIERRIRAAFRTRAIDQWGGSWKDSLVNPSYSKRVLERAGEVAYPTISKVNATRDPLEWLTLPELLAMREEKTQLGDLGMSATYWRRLANEVIPIRNQVSHMRLTRPGDLAKLKQWDAILSQRLKP